jgi:signal transduction histidine kinase
MVYGIKIFPYGNLFVPIYVILVGYGMLKYQLMDFKIAFRRMALVFGIYTLLVFLSLPFTWPLFQSIKATSPDLVPRILFLLTFIPLLLGAGPLIYAYLIRHNYWLRGHLTTGLTHELKSPLNAIQSASEIILDLLKNPAFDKTKTAEYVTMIQMNASRLESFVGDLLSVAKIQEGDLTVDKDSIDLSQLVRTAAEPYFPLAAQKGIAIHLELNGAFKIEADAEKIQQVLSNLLSNAIKFSDKGEITINLCEGKEKISCSVEDQGCGIPPQHLNRIFERFFQGSKSSRGAGIGLTIAKAWVEAHGGKIWAESEGEGKGTKVTFTLPV